MCLVLATCEGVNSGKVRIRTELAHLSLGSGLAGTNESKTFPHS